MMEGVNSTMIYCKKFCKCHMYPQYNNNFFLKVGF
jgi:methylphosphotriester-DNA--protein-cysteine methyltransferase